MIHEWSDHGMNYTREAKNVPTNPLWQRCSHLIEYLVRGLGQRYVHHCRPRVGGNGWGEGKSYLPGVLMPLLMLQHYQLHSSSSVARLPGRWCCCPICFLPPSLTHTYWVQGCACSGKLPIVGWGNTNPFAPLTYCYQLHCLVPTAGQGSAGLRLLW